MGVTQNKEAIMTNAAHTPGPWRYDCGNDGAVVYKEDIGTIANVPDDLIHSKANARLIAASPELLEAAELVIARWSEGDLAEAVRFLDSAVTAAKGGAK
jgi:hypothetical protein